MTSSCKEFRKGKLLCYGILVEWKILHSPNSLPLGKLLIQGDICFNKSSPNYVIQYFLKLI